MKQSNFAYEVLQKTSVLQYKLLVANIKDTYSDYHFEKTFRASNYTFYFILSYITHDLERKAMSEEPVSPGVALLFVCIVLAEVTTLTL